MEFGITPQTLALGPAYSSPPTFRFPKYNDGRGQVACWTNAQKSLNVQTRRRNSWLRSLSQQSVPTHGIVLRFGLGAGHRPALAFCRTPWEIARHYDSRALGSRSCARSLRPRNSPAAACWCVIVWLYICLDVRAGPRF